MKSFIIAGNWKMNKTVSESLEFMSELNNRLETVAENSKFEKIEVLIFPPFTSLYPLKNKSKLVSTGSQNLYFEEKGAFTGEISGQMVKEVAKYSLIGHSERREIFGETNKDINKKIKSSLNIGLIPLVCLGETIEERESGKTFEKIESQLIKGLEGLDTSSINRIVFAYEPIWAIGTGKNASPEQAQEIHSYIAEKINMISGKTEKRIILYGGSVKPDNCKDLLLQKDISGALIGGASLNVESFFAIIENSLELV